MVDTSAQSTASMCATLVANLERQVRQIDVHRQPRQVTYKQIDRRAALEREARFSGHERQQLDQQCHLSVKRVVSAQHRTAPVR
jgi:alkylated DNA nucleotide flippase Atl1